MFESFDITMLIPFAAFGLIAAGAWLLMDTQKITAAVFTRSHRTRTQHVTATSKVNLFLNVGLPHLQPVPSFIGLKDREESTVPREGNMSS